MNTTSTPNFNETGSPSPPIRPAEMSAVFSGCGERPQLLRFWEIEYFLKCPVVGTCLEMNEQKQILKKAGINFKKKTYFEIHEILVGSAEDENRLSKKIDGFLNRKFCTEIEAFCHIGEDEFMRLWRRCFQRGEVEGLLWVAASRRGLSRKARKEVFGDIHTEMHLSAGRNRKVRQLLENQQEETRRLAQRLKEINTLRRDLRKENKQLEKALSRSQKTCDLLNKKNRELEQEISELQAQSLVPSLQAENKQLKADLLKANRSIERDRDQVHSLRDQNAQLLSKLEKQRDLNGELRAEMERTASQVLALDRCDDECPAFDLCQKRILVVGGITRMEALYRQLIEGNGGKFDYHDGYLKGGIKCLENRVKRADVVLCSTNCNSHTACLAVKKLGKKHKKPVRMLASSSLNSISQTLMEHQNHINIQ
jgi:hypothetical protein